MLDLSLGLLLYFSTPWLFGYFYHILASLAVDGLFLRLLLPALIAVDASRDDVRKIVEVRWELRVLERPFAHLYYLI